MQSVIEPWGPSGWLLERSVLPQHTDHGGVMWHGAYVAWLEEARVTALAAVGLAYSDLSALGLELPVVHLAIDYRQALHHGDSVRLWSQALPGRGVRWPWRSWFVAPGGAIAAQAQVELVLVDLSAGTAQRKVLRRLPPDLAAAMQALASGPC